MDKDTWSKRKLRHLSGCRSDEDRRSKTPKWREVAVKDWTATFASRDGTGPSLRDRTWRTRYVDWFKAVVLFSKRDHDEDPGSYVCDVSVIGDGDDDVERIFSKLKKQDVVVLLELVATGEKHAMVMCLCRPLVDVEISDRGYVHVRRTEWYNVLEVIGIT